MISGWLVVLLAALATRFVFELSRPGPGLRIAWGVLVLVVLLRAVYRTHRALQARRG